jgi:indole-3-glycerol phosphate synthase
MILDKIVATKREEIVAARRSHPLSHLRAQLSDAPPVRDFLAALRVEGPVKLIAEIKKASPSRGVIREDFDPLSIARTYQQHGATCISVLTDATFFQGSLQYLWEIRREIGVPLLRKDFILDAYQLVEARMWGADAVLLIAECLENDILKSLYDETLELGMTPLVEFYLPENLDRVVQLGAELIGVNNRDLRSFETDLEHTLRMRARIPADRVVVGESGIRTPRDVQRLHSAGVDAMLVGESLMASADIGAAVDALLAD